MSEGNVDRSVQVLSRWVGNHDRDDFGEDLEGNGVFFFFCQVLKRSVYSLFQVLVAQQCGQSKTCLGHSGLVHVFEGERDLFIRVKRSPGYGPSPAAVVQSVLRSACSLVRWICPVGRLAPLRTVIFASVLTNMAQCYCHYYNYYKPWAHGLKHTRFFGLHFGVVGFELRTNQ